MCIVIDLNAVNAVALTVCFAQCMEQLVAAHTNDRHAELDAASKPKTL